MNPTNIISRSFSSATFCLNRHDPVKRSIVISFVVVGILTVMGPIIGGVLLSNGNFSELKMYIIGISTSLGSPCVGALVGGILGIFIKKISKLPQNDIGTNKESKYYRGKEDHISSLPPEICLEIFKYLGISDLGNSACVSRYFNGQAQTALEDSVRNDYKSSLTNYRTFVRGVQLMDRFWGTTKLMRENFIYHHTFFKTNLKIEASFKQIYEKRKQLEPELKKMLFRAIRWAPVIDLVNTLLFLGAAVNRTSRSIKFAIRCHSFHLVPLLIAYGASVNAKNNENTSPLILACRENNLPLVRLLLQNGAAQTINHCKRESALHIAAFYADQKIIQLLLDHGADKTLLNSSNRIPAQQATRPKIRALLETL